MLKYIFSTSNNVQISGKGGGTLGGGMSAFCTDK